MKKLMIVIGLFVLGLVIVNGCGKKDQPQTKQGIVPANLFVNIPGSKIGN